MRLIIIPFTLISILFSCKQKVVEGNKTEVKLAYQDTLKILENTTTCLDSLWSGVLELNTNPINKQIDTIFIYNLNGSPFGSIVFPDDDSGNKIEPKFTPFAFHHDYYLLVFKIAKITSKYYEVIINECTLERKLLLKSDKNFIFQSWEQHILKNTFSVGFDIKENQPKEQPKVRSKGVNIEGDYRHNTYFPKKIIGDWLLITWEEDEDSEKKEAWIRWKENKKLLLDLYYFA